MLRSVISRWIFGLCGWRERPTPSRGSEEAPATSASDEWEFHPRSAVRQQVFELWLWWPPIRSAATSYRLIRWLKNPSERVRQLEPLAELSNGGELTVLAPVGVSGELMTRLAPAGTEVTNGQPLARIIADEPGAFEPAAAYAIGAAAGTTVVAKLMSLNEISILAAVGAVALASVVVALAAMITFIIVGGLLAPIIAAAAMAVVTGCLRLGEYLMEEPRGEPS